MTMTRAEQKKELMEVLQDAPIKMVERFKRDFERMTFQNDADFNDWIDGVCFDIDHVSGQNDRYKSMISQAMKERAKRQQQESRNTVIYGLENVEYHEQRIKGLK